jgi:zinc and cadmium transporter
VSWLVLFGAGNFIYIAASDLVPEIKSEKSSLRATIHFGAFAAGLVITFLLACVAPACT